MGRTPSGKSDLLVVGFDFDGTLIDGMQQDLLFERLGIDKQTFWNLANNARPNLEESYPWITFDDDLLKTGGLVQAYQLARTVYPDLPPLTNRLLRDVGAELVLRPGVVDLFDQIRGDAQEMGLRLRIGVLTTGYAQMVRGSAIGPRCDFVHGHEFAPKFPPFGDAHEVDMMNAPLYGPVSVVSADDKATLLRAELDGTEWDPLRSGVRPSEPDWHAPRRNVVYVSDMQHSDFAVADFTNAGTSVFPGGLTVGICDGPAEEVRLGEHQAAGRVSVLAPPTFWPRDPDSAGGIVREHIAEVGLSIVGAQGRLAPVAGARGGFHHSIVDRPATLEDVVTPPGPAGSPALALIEHLASSKAPILLSTETARELMHGATPEVIKIYGIRNDSDVEAVNQTLAPFLEDAPAERGVTAGEGFGFRVEFQWLHPRSAERVSVSAYQSTTIGHVVMPISAPANGHKPARALGGLTLSPN